LGRLTGEKGIKKGKGRIAESCYHRGLGNRILRVEIKLIEHKAKKGSERKVEGEEMNWHDLGLKKKDWEFAKKMKGRGKPSEKKTRRGNRGDKST